MRSDKNVYFMVQLTIHEGKDDAFRGIVDEMCVATAKEAEALNYEWSLSEDGRTCHVLERYADSDGVRAHLENIGAFIDRFMVTADVVGVEVFGDPDAVARDALSQFGARFNRPYAGFVR